MADSTNQYAKLAKEIIALVGGKENISKAFNCVTRLRFYLHEPEKIDIQQIENLEGVMGTTQGSGQFQIIIGPDVEDVYKEVESQLASSDQKSVDVDEEEPSRKIENLTPYQKIKKGLGQLIGIITGSIMPVISILAAAGVIKSILTVLTVSTDLISTTSSAYLIINAMADAVFYFLPVMIAFNAAKQIGANPLMTAVVAGVIIHPTIIDAANEGLNIMTLGTLNFPFISYTYSIFPMIIAAWMIKMIEPKLKEWSPRALQSILVPMITIAFVSGITLLVTGPVIM